MREKEFFEPSFIEIRLDSSWDIVEHKNGVKSERSNQTQYSPSFGNAIGKKGLSAGFYPRSQSKNVTKMVARQFVGFYCCARLVIRKLQPQTIWGLAVEGVKEIASNKRHQNLDTLKLSLIETTPQIPLKHICELIYAWPRLLHPS